MTPDTALERPPDGDGGDDAPGAGGEGLGLAVQLDRIEARLHRLLAETEEAGGDVRALTRHLTAPPGQTAVDRSLAELLARVEAAHDRIEELAGSLGRLGRVQFKANALQDGTSEQVRDTLSALQEIATRKDEARAAREAEEARRAQELRAQGRVEMAVELLPVLDGIERALDSGLPLLERERSRVTESAGAKGPDRPSGSLGGFLRALLGGGTTRNEGTEEPGERKRTHALEAWLEGLALGRERFLALLADEGVEPIPALDRPFDPRVHAAVATEARDDVSPGTVVRVLRAGYRHADRPIRFAEVVVSRPSS